MNRYTEPEFGASALITIDTQRDVLDGQPLEVPGTSAVLPRIRALAEAFRSARRPIVHVVRLYRHDGSNVDLCRRRAVERRAATESRVTRAALGQPGFSPRRRRPQETSGGFRNFNHQILLTFALIESSVN